ncbi:UNVERIFIED_CONTAM: hypothetical protein FKN15_063216 [Acipenser sinensis]
MSGLKRSVDKIPTKESPPAELEQKKEVQKSEEKKTNLLSEEKPVEIPAIDDVDKENLDDPCLSAEYAKDIFDYLKKREEKFVIPYYMDKQSDLNREMRAILVDWMIEVQENFELNHETLYLAVKLVDHFLTETVCMRETLQLIGSSAMLISSKFETPTLEYYTGYAAEELVGLVKRLNFLITYPDDKLKAVRNKYSHKVFFEVAKLKPLDMLKLQQIISEYVEKLP